MAVKLTKEFLTRVFRIKYGENVGTCFYITLHGVRMLVTAAHLVKGIVPGDNIGLRQKNEWKLFKVKRYEDAELGLDVCVLQIDADWDHGLGEKHLDPMLALGSEVVYCGFPLSLEIQGAAGNNGFPIGFVKGAIFSGWTDNSEGGSQYMFDTINNRGFSGGPIVKLENDKLRIVAVVAGYKFDAAAPVYVKLEGGQLEETPDYFVKPNSGFMIAVPINRALDAAKRIFDAEREETETGTA